MPRSIRCSEAGLRFHVVARGNDRQPIFADDDDRRSFTGLLTDEVRRRAWEVDTACLMGNHFHVVLRTPEPDLSPGLQRMLGTYVQRFNRRHERTGHLFGRRFYSKVVWREGHRLALFRYIANNAVKDGFARHPLDYPWSTHAALAGRAMAPAFLSLAGRDEVFGSPGVYAAWIDADPDPRDHLGTLLHAGGAEGVAIAHDAGFTYAQIADRLGISVSTVGRNIREMSARRAAA